MEKFMQNLRDFNFFSKFSDKDLELLEKISLQKDYGKDEILFYEGDEPKRLYILLEGSLKLYKTNLKGAEIFLHLILPVNFVAEIANFENIPYPATASFISNSSVLSIDYEKFKQHFLNNLDMAFTLVRSLSHKLKITSEILHKELILSSEAKIAKLLVENGELFGIIKNVNIASILNITPETLSRTLTKFKKEKLLSFDFDGKIKELNPEILKSFYA